MSIGSVTINDPLVNFFRAVDAARQRNTVTFGQSPEVLETKTPKTVSRDRTLINMQTSAVSSETAVNGVRTAVQTKSKILGSFFDAYA